MGFEGSKTRFKGLEFLLEFALDVMVLAWTLASRVRKIDGKGLSVSRRWKCLDC